MTPDKFSAQVSRIYTDRETAYAIQDAVNKYEIGDKDPSTLSQLDVDAFKTRYEADAMFKEDVDGSIYGYGVPEFVVLKAADRIRADIPEAMERNVFEVAFAKVRATLGRLEFLFR